MGGVEDVLGCGDVVVGFGERVRFIYFLSFSSAVSCTHSLSSGMSIYR